MRLPLLILSGFLLLTAAAPLLTDRDPMQTRPDAQLQPPGGDFLFGTDYLGRDMFSRTLYGGQRTLFITSLATLTAVLPGTLIGVLAGMSCRTIDKVISTLLNVMMAFPSLVLALVILTLVGPGMFALALAVGLAGLSFVARVIRAAVMQVRVSGYIEAARAMGASEWHTARHHILSGIRPILLAYTGVTFSYCLFNSAALTLLGLSGEPGVPDWGVMLADGRQSFRAAPWVALAPGLAITITIVCINTLIDRYNARQG